MTQPSDGQRRGQLHKELADLEHLMQYVDWMDGYSIKRILEELLVTLRKGL